VESLCRGKQGQGRRLVLAVGVRRLHRSSVRGQLIIATPPRDRPAAGAVSGRRCLHRAKHSAKTSGYGTRMLTHLPSTSAINDSLALPVERYVVAEAGGVLLIDPGAVARFCTAAFGDITELRARERRQRPAFRTQLAFGGLRAVERAFALAGRRRRGDRSTAAHRRYRCGRCRRAAGARKIASCLQCPESDGWPSKPTAAMRRCRQISGPNLE
jgi:hypothetical protein